MRRFLFCAVIAIALVFTFVPAAAADDLGLDGITITRVQVLKSGDARVAGTIQCSQDLEWADISISMRQDVGRFHTVLGYGWDEVACSAGAGSVTFSVLIEPELARFGPNRAVVEGWAWTEQCWWDPDTDDEFCVSDDVGFDPTLLKVRRAH